MVKKQQIKSEKTPKKLQTILAKRTPDLDISRVILDFFSNNVKNFFKKYKEEFSHPFYLLRKTDFVTIIWGQKNVKSHNYGQKSARKMPNTDHFALLWNMLGKICWTHHMLDLFTSKQLYCDAIEA